MDAPNVVRLPAGDIELTDTVLVGPTGSGKVYKGASDGSTRIMGGLKVGPWEKRGDGVWAAPIPLGPDGARVYAESLFVNGRRAARARLPDSGFFHPEADSEETKTSGSATGWRQALKPQPLVARGRSGAVQRDALRGLVRTREGRGERLRRSALRRLEGAQVLAGR